MQLTEHAYRRSIQRNIPTDIIEVIHTFGSEMKAPGGATRLFLDRASLALATDGGEAKRSRLERYINAYVVVGREGRVLTVARRRHRFFN